MHSAGISVLAGAPGLEAVVQHISSRLHLLPRYRQRLNYVPLNLAQPLWVDDADFDLARHLTEHQAPAATQEAALSYAADLNRECLLRDRPLWRMHLIHFGEQALLLHIVHHAVLDGVSVGDDAQVLFDLKPDLALTEAPPWQAQAAPDAMRLVSEAMQDNTRAFGAQTQQLRNPSQDQHELLRRATESVTRFVTEPVQMAPWNSRMVGSERNYECWSMPDAAVRKIRRALGGTENDVVLTIVGEAAARYIAEVEGPRDGMHLRVMCPVRVRREDADGVRGNRLSGIFPILDAQPTDVLARHQQVRWETDGIRQSREAQSLQLLVELAPPLPALPGSDWFTPTGFGSLFTHMGLNPATFNPMRLLGQLMPQNLGLNTMLPGMGQTAGFNLACVTMPGAQTTQYFAGAQVDQQLLIPALAGNLGYAVAVTSYARELTFNLVCDPNLLPELSRMAAFIAEVADELAEQASQTAATE